MKYLNLTLKTLLNSTADILCWAGYIYFFEIFNPFSWYLVGFSSVQDDAADDCIVVGIHYVYVAYASGIFHFYRYGKAQTR